MILKIRKLRIKGKENLCRNTENVFTYGFYWGGYATAMQHPSKFYFHLPDGFKLEKAAPLFRAGITTYYPLEKYLTTDTKTIIRVPFRVWFSELT